MARTIKRYENRKLYDTEASAYVSLSDIADLVREGETVEVVDNATGQDLTAQTLTQVILEEGKNGRTTLPSDALHTLLRRSGQALDQGLEQIRSSVDDLVKSSLTRLQTLLQQPPRVQELEELRQRLAHLEHQLGTLIDATDVDLDDPASAPPSSDAAESDSAASGTPRRNGQAAAEASAPSRSASSSPSASS
jgi:polyhydroxyalkanoate synthesis repressor PhaR